MKIVFDKEELLSKLSLASRFTSSRLSSVSSLQGVLIISEGDKLALYSTNLNSYFKTSLKGRAVAKTKILIEPRKIIEFLSFLSQGKVEMEITDRKLILTRDKTGGAFPLMEGKDFPQPPDLAKEKEQKTKTDFLLKNLPLLLFSASPDETRPVLTGINFITQDEDLIIVATDGFRLSLFKTKKEIPVPQMLIPREFLEEVLKLIKDEEEVGLIFSSKEKTFSVRVGETQLYSRLIEGDFPPYEKVIPAEHKMRVILDKEEFMNNIKLISVFARDFSNIVILDFSKDGLVMKPKMDGEEQTSAWQEIQMEGEPQQVAFNFKFILDFLNQTTSKKVVVEILRPDAPAVFKLEGNKDFIHIIMPVRLQA